MTVIDRYAAQPIALEGHFTSCTTNEHSGKQVTTAVFKDADGNPIYCVWRESEGFYLKETEKYKVSGNRVVHNGRHYLFEPSIVIVNDEPTVIPNFAQSPVRKKIDWGSVFGVLFWGGIILWGIASYSPSNNTSTTGADTSDTLSSTSETEEIQDSAAGDYDTEVPADEPGYDASDYDYEYDSSDYEEDESYDGYTNSAGDYVPSPSYSGGSTVGGYSPTAVCEDGTYSYSQSRSGTCSHHGGVSSWY